MNPTANSLSLDDVVDNEGMHIDVQVMDIESNTEDTVGGYDSLRPSELC